MTSKFGLLPAVSTLFPLKTSRPVHPVDLAAVGRVDGHPVKARRMVSALDVSVQAQVLNLRHDLQDEQTRTLLDSIPPGWQWKAAVWRPAGLM